MKSKRHIIYKTDHLKDGVSWTSGLAGVIRLLTWETETALGISKTQLQKRVLDHVFESCENEILSKEKFDAIVSQLETKTRLEIESATAENLYDKPKKGILINPIEAQRRIRLFSEEFLNKEFDVFMSLLPSSVLSDYLSLHFNISRESQWSIIGSSNDFEASTDMKFMYMDTLAYAHNTSALVALELKMDSDIGKDQILKYCFMAAYLEFKGFIAKDTTFHILIVGNDSSLTDELSSLRSEAAQQLQNKEYPRKKISYREIESLVPLAETHLHSIDIKNTTWQEFGDHFNKLKQEIPNHGHSESLFKLIEGFLTSLEIKHSRKQKGRIYLSKLKDN